MTKEQKNVKNRVYYLSHREEAKTSTRMWRQAHPEQVKAIRRTYLLAHREELAAKSRAYHLAHREQQNARSLAYDKALTTEGLRIFGDKCACPGCEVREPVFLTIDHINGRPKGSRKNALLEARASGWDKTKFQILCMNCNFAKRDRGFCPVHQAGLEQTNGHSPP